MIQQNDLKLEAAKTFNKRFPDNTNSLRDLYQSYMDVGSTYTKNAPEDALKFFEAARTTAKKASSLEPKNPEFLYAVYETQVKSGVCNQIAFAASLTITSGGTDHAQALGS